MMRKRTSRLAAWLSVALLVLVARPAAAQFYAQHNLVSDGAVPADLVDPNLVNAWGLVSSPTSPWWISDNGTGRSTLYNVGTGPSPWLSRFQARWASRARRLASCGTAAPALS